MVYAFYIILAMIVSYILMVTRHWNMGWIGEKFESLNSLIGWTVTAYSLILSFTISNFYDRYVDIRNTLVEESTHLKVIYRSIGTYDNNINTIQSIHEYVVKITNATFVNKEYGIYSDELGRKYRQMSYAVFELLKEDDTNIGSNILSQITSNEKIRTLLNEIEAGQYMINLLGFLLIFVIMMLWFVKVTQTIQFIAIFCILSVLLTAIYLITILNNPFLRSPLYISLEMYETLLYEIEEDYPEFYELRMSGAYD